MIGRRILSEALDRGHEVVAVVRDRPKLSLTHPALCVLTGDVLEPASIVYSASGQDVVVSAVGGGHGDVAGHLATAEPAVRSLVAGLRVLNGSQPGIRLITVGGAGSLRTSDG